ncbi:hypothetical protein FOMPIDRAFT_158157 [Fomitopsis schrenkii]|uniref:Uncharacterized protein n=1 Tax=Fomitopsis schrenkii TaxID=2126942 RepID=S8FTQ2_FOMSC|nr:hypothetical protein FOMPIDRAFT_158157 [Fomitopsis schrenkii]
MEGSQAVIDKNTLEEGPTPGIYRRRQPPRNSDPRSSWMLRRYDGRHRTRHARSLPCHPVVCLARISRTPSPSSALGLISWALDIVIVLETFSLCFDEPPILNGSGLVRRHLSALAIGSQRSSSGGRMPSVIQVDPDDGVPPCLVAHLTASTTKRAPF